ncbi:MAG: hypothetical protein PHP37_03855 [Patescibacteria group bacterium]|nr:hypothetical protein [Patescibacteria group bacterium]
MPLPLIISRLTNLLFFIQKTDQQYLVEFNLQKYLADENFNLFYYGKTENKIWEQIGQSIGKENTKQFQKAVASLESIFTPHWRKASEHLFLWKKYFQSNQSLLQQIISDIGKLSGVEKFNIYKVPIYLVSDPLSRDKEINAWFSWTPKESFIVIEIPFGLKVPNNFFPLSVLAHEFFHLVLRKNKNLLLKITEVAKENEKLFTKLGEGMPNRIFLEELLISSFIPEGYLSEKYLNTKIVPYTSKLKDLLRWRRFVAFKLYQTAKRYVNNAQQIDEKYLKRLIGIIRQNAK